MNRYEEQPLGAYSSSQSFEINSLTLLYVWFVQEVLLMDYELVVSMLALEVIGCSWLGWLKTSPKGSLLGYYLLC